MRSMVRRVLVGGLGLCLGGVLTSCTTTAWHDSSSRTTHTTPQPQPQPTATRPQTRTPADTTTASGSSPTARPRAGNPPFYEVFGQRYFVLPDDDGYREQGIASWYGEPFHGRRTSSGEVYDMHGLTAAHKTLPLPSQVRVTNLDSGRSVVVTVNDRGPFVKDRIIDLSYAAAKQLGIVESGTCRVEVESIPGQPEFSPIAASPITGSPITGSLAPSATTIAPVEHLFMQVGAFGSETNANRLKAQLESNGVGNVVIRHDDTTSPVIYRVRIGPIENSTAYDMLASRVASLRIANPRLVTESRVPP